MSRLVCTVTVVVFALMSRPGVAQQSATPAMGVAARNPTKVFLIRLARKHFRIVTVRWLSSCSTKRRTLR